MKLSKRLSLFSLRPHRLLFPIFHDVQARRRLVLAGTLPFQASLALFYLITGVLYRAVWLYLLFLYQIPLLLLRHSLLRAFLMQTEQAPKSTSLSHARLCGVSLIALTPALALVIGFLLARPPRHAYHGSTAVILALYTLIAFGIALHNLLANREEKSPIVAATEAVSATTASVSLFALTNTLLSLSPTPDSLFPHSVLSPALGAVTCLFVLSLGIGMVRRFMTSKKIKAAPREIDKEKKI